jgi:hypothetical protein
MTEQLTYADIPPFHDRCTVCGSIFPNWFDACPDCANAGRKVQIKDKSEIMQNVCEEHRCPRCNRSAALKIIRCSRADGTHFSKRRCHWKDCKYYDEVPYWPSDVRQW